MSGSLRVQVRVDSDGDSLALRWMRHFRLRNLHSLRSSFPQIRRQWAQGNAHDLWIIVEPAEQLV